MRPEAPRGQNRRAAKAPWLSVALLTACHAAAPAKSGPTLEPCRLPGVATPLRCARVEVFEDRAAKAGRKLSVHAAVAKALSGRAEADPLFILAGGPGQAASDVLPLLLPALDRVRRTRDLVFVDQRGTGRSAPLECDPPAPPDAGLSESLSARLDEQKVRRCRQKLEADHDLAHYGTSVAMDDLDDVRAALGYERINLWGSSYGTRAALVYARAHPDRVRSLVLDGVAPLSLVYPTGLAEDTDRALRLLFRACADDPECAESYPYLEASFERLLGSLSTPRVVEVVHPRTGLPEKVQVTREVLTRALQTLLYQPEAAVLVPLTLARSAKGDFQPLLAQAELLGESQGSRIAVGMFLSVICTEDSPFLDEKALLEAAEASFTGRAVVEDVLQACRVWPKGAVPQGFHEPVRSAAPALVLSGALDPVTPPRRGQEAAATLPSARHVVFPATGHGATLTACGRRLVADFVAKGSAEGLDTSCVPSRRPPFFVRFSGPSP